MEGFWSECAFKGVATVSCIPLLVGHLVNFALTAAGAVAVFFIVWGGFKFIRSGGDPKQVEGARQSITYAIIGLVVVLLAYFFIYFISVITGVECIRVFGFSQCTSEDAASSGASGTQPGTSAVTTPQTGDLGCFYGNTTQAGTVFEDKSCYPYGDNDPVSARRWFRGVGAAEECSSYCGSLTVQ